MNRYKFNGSDFKAGYCGDVFAWTFMIFEMFFAMPNTGHCQAEFSTQVDYTTAARPATVAASDFDRDGDLDLAIANVFSNSISILINRGDGTYLSPANYEVGSLPSKVVTADFDRDGQIDVAVSNVNSSDVSVLRNIGNGVFAPQVVFPVGNPTPGVTSPFSMTTGDFNGDGAIDIATANANFNTPVENTVSILLTGC